MKTLIVAALLGTVAAGGVAVAQTAAAPIARPMHGDANADGKLSRGEFVKQAEARFAAMDVNKDGSLTRDEARPGRAHPGPRGRFGPAAFFQEGPPPPPPGGQMGGPGGPGGPGAQARGPGGPGGGMMRFDTDGDGKLSRAEYDALSARRFARMDANGDGTIDKAEADAMPGAGRPGAPATVAMSRADFDAQQGQRFTGADTNHDGVLDAAELQAAPMGWGGGRRQQQQTPPPPPAPTGA